MDTVSTEQVIEKFHWTTDKLHPLTKIHWEREKKRERNVITCRELPREHFERCSATLFCFIADEDNFTPLHPSSRKWYRRVTESLECTARNVHWLLTTQITCKQVSPNENGKKMEWKRKKKKINFFFLARRQECIFLFTGSVVATYHSLPLTHEARGRAAAAAALATRAEKCFSLRLE